MSYRRHGRAAIRRNWRPETWAKYQALARKMANDVREAIERAGKPDLRETFMRPGSHEIK